jgi:UDP-glucose 4-epimerase
VELENLSQIYLRRDAPLCVTLLRPCNILGPGVRNTLSLMLRRRWAPVIVGHAPPMQFLHVDDMAEALVRTLAQPQPGVFNVAPAEAVAYPDALRHCGCRALPLWPSVSGLRLLDRVLGRHSLLPAYLLPYLQYPVLLDSSRFRRQFGWTPRRRLEELFADYARLKS